MRKFWGEWGAVSKSRGDGEKVGEKFTKNSGGESAKKARWGRNSQIHSACCCF